MSGSGPEAAAGATPRKGMSTGAKVFFGCLALAFLGVVGVVVALAVGGVALKRGFESAMGSVEEHREATETLHRLETEHPFEPPADGVVGEERLQRFLAVTDDAWQEMQPWADDLRDLRDAARPFRGGLGRLQDVAAGARAIGGLARSRLALAAALDRHDVSLGEYAWTGLTLARAAEAREKGGGATDQVPEANLALVEAHSGELPGFDADDGSGVVLAVATLWGVNELPMWEGLGLDTLVSR